MISVGHFKPGRQARDKQTLSLVDVTASEHLADRISIDPSFLQDVRALITPGTTLVLTNARVSSQTHSGPGFNILTTASQALGPKNCRRKITHRLHRAYASTLG
jgi:hypothetical protein